MTTRQWITVAINIVIGVALVLYQGIPHELSLRAMAIQALSYSLFISVLLFAVFKAIRWDAKWITVLFAAIVITFAYSILLGVIAFAPELTTKLGGGFILAEKERNVKAGLAVVNFVLMYWSTRERRTNR